MRSLFSSSQATLAVSSASYTSSQAASAVHSSFKLSALAVALCAAGISATALPVMAQSQTTVVGAAAGTGATEAEVERIEVRGTYRQQSLQKVAGSLVVVDEAQWQRQSAQHLEDILQGMGNVNFAAGASRGRFLQMRGIGERSEFVDTINPSVGVIVDGIDYSSVGLSGLTDLAQIEVFRGPESSRFGAAAMAGTLYASSQDPWFDRSATTLSATVANYNSQQLQATHNAVFSEQVAARLTLDWQRSDGFIRNTFLQRDDTNNIDEKHLHGKVRYLASADLTIDTVWNHHHVDNGYDAFSLNNNRTTLSDQPGQDRQQINAFSVKADYRGLALMDSTTLITALLADTDYNYDEDWSFKAIHPEAYSTFDRYVRDRQNVSVEQRFQSKADAQHHWVAGVYVAVQQTDLDRFYTDNFEASTSLFQSQFDRQQLALFGEYQWQLANDWQLTTGLRAERYSDDYADNAKASVDGDDWMLGGKVALNYSLDQDTQLYALVSRGYKAGGVNGEALLKLADARFNQYWDFLRRQSTFGAETLLNREIGIKQTAWSQRLVSRIALFSMLRHDMQVNGWINQGTRFAGYISNASQGANQGVEWEASWQATDNFRLQWSLALLDSEIRGYSALINKQLVSMEGRDQAHAPRRQTSLGWSWQMTERAALDMNWQYKAGYYYSDSHFFQAQDVDLLNMRWQYQWEQVNLSLWARNALNRDYGVRGFFFANDPRDGWSRQEWQQLGEPRRVGLTVRYEF